MSGHDHDLELMEAEHGLELMEEEHGRDCPWAWGQALGDWQQQDHPHDGIESGEEQHSWGAMMIRTRQSG